MVHLWNQMVPLQLIRTITCPEGCLMNILILGSYLMVTRPEVNIGKYLWSSHLIKEVINPRQRILVLHSDLVQLYEPIHNQSISSFSFSNQIGAPYWDTLGLTYFFPITLAAASSALAFLVYSPCRVSWTLVIYLAQVQPWDQCPCLEETLELH